jgi:uracil-DNA glycosylase family 4
VPQNVADAWWKLQQDIADCAACPRLVAWRESVAADKVKRFAQQTYWGKAVPSFGQPSAQLLIVGLAPAAHGANRTGRMFTGDRSGQWLYRALHKAGLANQPTFESAEDGLVLINTTITAVCHCAPPDNKPLPDEIAACRPFIIREKALLTDLRVIIALGKLAFDQVVKHWGLTATGTCAKSTKPVFSHGSQVVLANDVALIGSYHPSQQNTFTGRLTEPMFDAIFEQAKSTLSL